MNNWNIEILRMHARRFAGYAISLQPANAASIVADIDALVDALWVCAEHNALHFGENHNTVIQARAAIKRVKP